MGDLKRLVDAVRRRVAYKQGLATFGRSRNRPNSGPVIIRFTAGILLYKVLLSLS
jgi:hypothetical protein